MSATRAMARATVRREPTVGGGGLVGPPLGREADLAGERDEERERGGAQLDGVHVAVVVQAKVGVLVGQDRGAFVGVEVAEQRRADHDAAGPSGHGEGDRFVGRDDLESVDVGERCVFGADPAPVADRPHARRRRAGRPATAPAQGAAPWSPGYSARHQPRASETAWSSDDAAMVTSSNAEPTLAAASTTAAVSTRAHVAGDTNRGRNHPATIPPSGQQQRRDEQEVHPPASSSSARSAAASRLSSPSTNRLMVAVRSDAPARAARIRVAARSDSDTIAA